MTENKSNKAIRLVKYLEQLSRLRSPAVSSYESYKKVVGFNDLFLEKYCYGPILFPDKNCANVLFEFQHRSVPVMPELPLICQKWCEDVKNPVKLKNTLETGEMLEDFPEVTSAFDDYLEKKYKPYKIAYSEWEKAQSIYSIFFDIHQELKRSSEDVELICGVGLLNWRFKDKKIIRHILTIGCELNFDPVNKKFTLTLDEQSKQIKVETEMLDESQLPLDLSSIINPFLEDIGNDIFEKDKIEVFLQKFVQCLDSEGQYSEDLSCKGISTKAPIISYFPALILRKRSSALLTQTLEHIRGNLLQQKDFPAGFKDLCEFTDGQNEGEISDSVDKTYHNDMIFFPKPSNAEQRKIAQKLAHGDTVVIQGPPGTGKSHTIANLICHLLAQGKRILIILKKVVLI